MRAILGCALVLAGCSGAAADDKKPDPIDAKKLVGKWELQNRAGRGCGVLEFAKDGTVMFATADGTGDKFTGTFKVDGNKLTVTLRADGQEGTSVLTVAQQTEAELVGTFDNGKDVALVRVKDKKDGEIDIEDLMGVWKAKDREVPKGLPLGVKFARDGVGVSVSGGGLYAGTFEVDGNKVRLKVKVDGREKVLVWTVSKLTHAELVTTNEDGKTFTLLRPKDEMKEEKIDPKKLVGKWSPKDTPAGTTAVMEFTKDGKTVFTISGGSMEERVDGTYKLDGNKLTLTTKRDGLEGATVVTVSKLTDTELVGKDERGTETTLLRAKDKKADPIDPAKLIGRWEPTVKKPGGAPVIEFMKGGRAVSTYTDPNGKEIRREVSYRLDGNKLVATLKEDGVEESETTTILKLTETELVLADEKGREIPRVRVKDK